MISYHFYAVPQPDETMDIQERTYFAAADGFLSSVGFIESIRQRLFARHANPPSMRSAPSPPKT